MSLRQNVQLVEKMAEVRTPSMARRFYRLIKSEVLAIADVIKTHGDVEGFIAGESDKWLEVHAELKLRYAIAYGIEGYKIGGVALGKKSYMRSLRAKQFPPDVDTSVFGADELVANHLKPLLSDWVTATATLETNTSARRYAEAWRKASQAVPKPGRGLTVQEIAAEFLESSLAETEARASLMARTMTNYSFNAGATEVYREEGIEQVEWMVTEDETTCDLCDAMDGRRAGTGTPFLQAGDKHTGLEGTQIDIPFDMPHPPLHPHCRCVLLPVIGEA